MDITVLEYHSREEMYAHIGGHIDDIFAETDDLYAALANTAALFRLYLDDVNWAGFYLMKGGGLVLGPFQGKPAVAQIKIGDGVCGTAVLEARTQRVDDVERCCNHIACDLSSRSELVTPIFVGGEIFGVIDIDSPSCGRFDEEDEKGFRLVAEKLGAQKTLRESSFRA